MKKEYYDDPMQAASEWQEESAEAQCAEEEVDAISYVDAEDADEDDIPEESTEKGKHKKSQERIALEERFLEIYEAYMHPKEIYSDFRVQCQLDDLYACLYALNKGWAYRKAKSYRLAGFYQAEGEEALSIGCQPLYEMLKNDRANGVYYPYAIPHYLKIAQRKAIDWYFRPNFGRLPPKKKPADGQPEQNDPAEELKPRKRKIPKTTSLDSPKSDEDTRILGTRLAEASVNPFENMMRPRRERDERSNRLLQMYIRELMNYPDDPPKPLALMYGNVLLQLYKEHGGEDEISRLAKKTPKISSAEWAHKRMGKATLRQLGIYSERIIQRCFGKSFAWGRDFCDRMTQLARDGSGRKWADIVYTENYTEGNTTDWIGSIMESTLKKCARKLKDDPDMREYAAETLNAKGKFRKALEKMEKEDSR